MADQGLEVFFFMLAVIFCVDTKMPVPKQYTANSFRPFFLNCQFSCISIIPNAEMSSVKSPY